MTSTTRQWCAGSVGGEEIGLIRLLQECTRAYAAGDVEKSYQISKQTKQLLSKARNSAVGVAEVNIQLIGAYRRQRQFGLALQMIQEAQQV
jgi:hypothetical protein